MYEKDIERKVCEYAREQGFLVYKFSSPARAAVPDRLLLRDGETFFIEFKAPGAVPTPAQLREHSRLGREGFEVAVIDDVEVGKQVIDDWIELMED